MCQPWAGGGSPACLPCSHRDCGPASGLASLASLHRAKPVPSGSDTLTKDLWNGGYVGSVIYAAPCTARLCSHTRAGALGCSRPGNHPAHSCYRALSTHWYFSLTPLPFTVLKCLQQADMRVAGISCVKEPNAQWNWVHLLRCFTHLPEAVDQAGLNYTLLFTVSAELVL